MATNVAIACASLRFILGFSLLGEAAVVMNFVRSVASIFSVSLSLSYIVYGNCSDWWGRGMGCSIPS